MKEYNEKKAKILYDFLDQSQLFKGTVEKKDRSLMNVPFVTGDADLDAEFVKAATAAGFVNLKGHRSVGGMRASIYNAMPIEGVEKLVAFMKDFEEAHKMMRNIYCFNAISKYGTDRLTADYALTDDLARAEGGAGKKRQPFMRRSLVDSLLAIARAGAGVNNIPLDRCAQ